MDLKNLLQEEGLCSERLRSERWEETDREVTGDAGRRRLWVGVPKPKRRRGQLDVGLSQ